MDGKKIWLIGAAIAGTIFVLALAIGFGYPFVMQGFAEGTGAFSAGARSGTSAADNFLNMFASNKAAILGIGLVFLALLFLLIKIAIMAKVAFAGGRGGAAAPAAPRPAAPAATPAPAAAAAPARPTAATT
jgi:Na+-transporting methylmalonyl-CoA/oxaloacetate decarboxylase gamma subunit